MPTLQEIIYTAGYTGQTNEAWHEFWDDEGIPGKAWNDRMFLWLGTLGYTGSLPDRISQFLDDGGTIS
jgi:hypothetical protein